MSKQISQFFAVMLPIERRAVTVIALMAMCRMFGLFALLPVLALYAADLQDATPALIGLAVGAYGLTQAALQIPFGAISDRIGRVPVILFGLALFAAGSIFAAQSDSIYGVVAGRLLQGAGAISATLTALLADATREEVRTRTMAVFGIAIGSAFLLALIIGPVIAAASGVRMLFWLAAVLAAVAALLLFLLPRGIERPAERPDRRIRAAFRPELLRLDFYIFVLHALLTASFVALPFLLRDELHLALTAHWQIYVGALLASLLGTVPLIFADERKGKSSTLTVAILLLVSGQLMLAIAGFNLTIVFVALAVFFAGFNFLEAGLPARLSIRASGDLRGASLGVFSSFQFLGAFAGGLIGGRFLAGGDPSAVFAVCALLAGAWLVVHRLAPETG
ncbi:MAG: MFS transporter [Proteobacteria bacterium]|nr:MFS transporter [Pseudomonadota bacterium]TDJ36830.1 MAG: MFS transporter [Gammaproteobacteria bacterium]